VHSIDNALPTTKDLTMTNATYTARPAAARVASFFLAVLASASVLGATVAGMQPRYDGAAPQVVALDSVTVTATKAN
jgi:hypothetical protein